MSGFLLKALEENLLLPLFQLLEAARLGLQPPISNNTTPTSAFIVSTPLITFKALPDNPRKISPSQNPNFIYIHKVPLPHKAAHSSTLGIRK